MKKLSLMVFFSLFSAIVTAQTIEDIHWYTEEYPPYNYMENGVLKGIAVDVLVEIWKKVGLKKTTKDINLVPWPRGVKMVKTKPGTCLFSTTLTNERKDVLGWKFVYPIPLINDEPENHVIARKSKHVIFNSVDDLKNYDGTFGIVNGDVGESLLSESGVNAAKFDRTANPISLIKKLEKGRYDVISYSFDTAKTKMKEIGVDPSQYEIVYEFPAKQMGYAFYHSTDAAILKKFQKALDELHSEGTTEKIKTKYAKP